MSPEIHDEITWDELPALFPEFENPGRWLPLLQRHLAMVQAAAPHTRVTSVPPEKAVRRQYAECLELLRVAGLPDAHTSSVVDVGSGGGYPGLLIAVIFSETPVALVEPLKKRARLLASMAADLGLARVSVVAERAEEAGRGPLRDSASLVTARAVAPLAELLEYAAPFARTGGRMVLAKGSALAVELDGARRAQDELRCAYDGTQDARPVISASLAFAVFRKLAPTPPSFPRRPGVPGKKPLQNG